MLMSNTVFLTQQQKKKKTITVPKSVSQVDLLICPHSGLLHPH